MILSWLERLRGSADFFPVAGLALTAQVALPQSMAQSMDAIQLSNGTQTLSDGDTLNRGNPSNHCKITNEQNKPLLPGKYLGQLNHRPPTVKSRESHEVSEIGERAESTRRSHQLIRQDRSPLFTKLNAIGFTP